MKDIKIGTIGIIIVMMLINVSVVYSQNDNAIIDNLLEKRKILIAEMNAEILEKDKFDKTSADKSCPSANECIFKSKDGKVLKEEYDANNNLMKDTFTDPKFKMELTTEYTVNKGVICRTLLNGIREDKLKLCNSCPLKIEPIGTPEIPEDTLIYGAFQDQWVWDLKTGNTLRIWVDCCGKIQKRCLWCEATNSCQLTEP